MAERSSGRDCEPAMTVALIGIDPDVTTAVLIESVMEKTTKRCPVDASWLRPSAVASSGHETEVTVAAEVLPTQPAVDGSSRRGVRRRVAGYGRRHKRTERQA